jgi:hypothetical protein
MSSYNLNFFVPIILYVVLAFFYMKRFVPRPGLHVAWAVCATSLAAITGLPLLFLSHSYGLIDSVADMYALAFAEEAMRYISLFGLLTFLKRGGTNPYNSEYLTLTSLAAFGFIFGVVEYLINILGWYLAPNRCAEMINGVSCEIGIWYLHFASFEGILFHIFITVTGYADISITKFVNLRNLIALFCASVIHALINIFRSMHILGSENSQLYVLLPFVLFCFYVLVFALRQRYLTYYNQSQD